jgi:ubiquinone biosynthesis monooxygenase Coq7
VHATIEAVETFVDHHYREQIDRLGTAGAEGALRAMLEHCRLEEVEHRDEAAALRAGAGGTLLRAWAAVVGWGSASAVAAARRV